jgi:hypothetical protein
MEPSFIKVIFGGYWWVWSLKKGMVVMFGSITSIFNKIDSDFVKYNKYIIGFKSIKLLRLGKLKNQ